MASTHECNVFLLIQFIMTILSCVPLSVSSPFLEGRKFKQLFKGQIDTPSLSQNYTTESLSSIFSLCLRVSSISLPFTWSLSSKILKFTKGNVESKIYAFFLSWLFIQFSTYNCKKGLLLHWVGVWAWWHLKSLPTLKF